MTQPNWSLLLHVLDGRADEERGGSSSEWRIRRAPEREEEVARPLIPADAALLDRLHTGDEAAFAEIFRAYTPGMYQVAAMLLGSRDAAADVVQSVMHRLWLQRETIVLHGALGGYLRMATVNAARNALRGESRARSWAERATAEDVPMVRAVAAPANDEEGEDDVRVRVLESAVAALPERTREIFMLWWGGELSYAEIAQVMGISIKGVERARARALDALREALTRAGLGPTAAG